MKSLFPFFLLVLSTSSTFAQIPDYFGNNPSWSTFSYYGPMIDPEMIGWTEKIVYHLNGTYDSDTHTYNIINERIYKTPLVGTEGPEDCDVPVASSYEIRVRQEGRDIYFLKGGVDSLFISYDLEPGDTVHGHFGALNPGLAVQEIDSFLLDGTYRRVFFTDTLDPYNPRFTEGIGHFGGSSGYYFGAAANYGEYWELDYSFHFRCYAENHVPKWPTADPEFADCYSLVNLEDNEITELFKYFIYPNPGSDQIMIRNMDAHFVQGHLLDLNGKVILHLDNQQINNPIDISQLNNGIFILQLEEANGEIKQLKFVKN